MRPYEYILKALGAFARRLVVISRDYRVRAAVGPSLRLAPEEMIGKLCHEVLRGLDSPCEDCALGQVFSTGRPAVPQMDMGGPYNRGAVLRHLFPIYDGEDITAVAVLDLDSRHFGGPDTELTSANSFLNNLIMSSVDGIIASDMTGKILIFNEAASEITGYDHQEALGELDIRDIYPGDGAREVMRLLRSDEYGGKGKLKSYRVDLLRKDGTTVPINLSVAVVYDCGREEATVGFFYDLREKMRMESELQQAQVQLVQAEKMSSLGKLAAGVAHQLNNPLGGVLLYSRIILEEYDLEADAKTDMMRIVENTERCQNIVRELLDFARQSSLEIRPNDLNLAISRTVLLLENQPLFKDIEIIKELDPALPLVPTDIQQLNHVFMNLILNAADAMEGVGRLWIKTRLGSGGGRVCIEISDSGPGIPNEILPHIFDPFFTTKEEGRGTGLGLSVTYGVIENHKGRITVCSAPGEGATFVLELPLERDETGESE